MQTLNSLLQRGRELLTEAGITDATTDAWLLFEYVFCMSRCEFLLKRDEKADEEKTEKFLELAALRSTRIPVQHITGVQEFMGLEFLVNENVLIPRQDTEVLVEKVVEWAGNQGTEDISILDMCTGSGCIAISLAWFLKHAKVTGADISEKALETARKNAERNGVDCEFIRTDMFEKVSGKYDVIVSNPPYIRSRDIEDLMAEVKMHEPPAALDGGEDGLGFYRIIARDARKFLKDGGCLALEIGFDQAAEVTALLEESGYESIEIIKDLPGLDRVVFATKHWRNE
ncbi:peptide chain release factor N(5)-glutamine methyltransferase [Parasporobacterium paucivorans]|uniref:Release factor glutamine methyltransferase n=1 Tax=Parasporobacterium paucivorans DSM 15970 TaxID=1122934 RepID=A0A1M6KES1_9FIRM|nr:peptide chain release factor N(5)-glutamine methyltransferase [Parasporobacterium paucivorans]SHJ57445.1 release factor glutamine methyltransferase [Parasporobacterium paucivorans DSM 15970]